MHHEQHEGTEHNSRSDKHKIRNHKVSLRYKTKSL